MSKSKIPRPPRGVVEAVKGDDHGVAASIPTPKLYALPSTLEQYLEEVAADDITGVLIVSGLCSRTPKALERLADLMKDKHKNKHVLKWFAGDASEFPQISAHEKIAATPTVLMYFRGKIIERCEGDNWQKVDLCAKAADLKRKVMKKEEEEVMKKEAAAAALEAEAAV